MTQDSAIGLAVTHVREDSWMLHIQGLGNPQHFPSFSLFCALCKSYIHIARSLETGFSSDCVEIQEAGLHLFSYRYLVAAGSATVPFFSLQCSQVLVSCCVKTSTALQALAGLVLMFMVFFYLILLLL